MATTKQEQPHLSTPVPDGATMAERAYLEVRDRIVELRIPPGALVREDELMEDLKMSRTPVREALLRADPGASGCRAPAPRHVRHRGPRG